MAETPNSVQRGHPGELALSVVVPVFNEEKSLAGLDQELLQALESIGDPAEIIYVDDCSTDGSPVELQRLLRITGGSMIEKRVIRLRRNFGQTAALASGFDHARGRVIVTLDADGQNNPADIPKLLERLDQGWDVVSGWRRFRKDKALSRRLPSRVANLLISMLSGVHLQDFGCTLKAYRASFLNGVSLYGEMHRFIPVYLAYLGARITELEVDHRPRHHGTSHYGSERIFKVSLDLVLIRFMSKYFTRPMHFFGQAALLFLSLAFLALVFMVVFKFGWLQLIGINYRASFIETPLPSLAVTFLIGSFSSLFFGIMSEVLMRAYHESQGRKPYLVESTWSSQQQIDNAATNEEPA
jgi:glycosyltransferase involved in cell wall biosynthesis